MNSTFTLTNASLNVLLAGQHAMDYTLPTDRVARLTVAELRVERTSVFKVNTKSSPSGTAEKESRKSRKGGDDTGQYDQVCSAALCTESMLNINGMRRCHASCAGW